MKNPSRAVLAVACALALTPASAPAAGPADVLIRVEGGGGTLVAETPVRTFAGGFRKSPDAPDCSGTSAGGALEVATRGDWGGAYDGFGQRVERIFSESHAFSSGAYWNLYINDRPSDFGSCGKELEQADEVLFFPTCEGADRPDCFTEGPLDFDAPRRVRPGEAFGVTVSESTTTCDANFTCTTTNGGAGGATITGGGQTVTTDAQGRATLTLAQRGEAELRATKGDRVPESQRVCVSDGADGFCGTARPGEAAADAAACETNGRDGRCGTADRQAPKTLIDSIRERQRFRRGRVARLLRGRAGVAARSDFRTSGLGPDPSGIASVELRLTRNDRGRCSTFDVRRERLVRRGCGAGRGTYFKIDEGGQWEYQLPFSLPRGRYVLDVRAVDRAGNKDFDRRRRENRVVFFVR